MPEIINRERLADGCGPIALDPALQGYAEAHSVVQATEDRMHHGEGPTGFASWGENVAAGQTSATQVVADWMGSPGHRANILNCEFDVIGVGSSDGYWTLVLAQ